MMTNLFSSFDPSTSKNLALNWIIITLPIILMPFNFWTIPSRMNLMLIFIMKMMKKEFNSIFKKKSINSSLTIFSIMSFILMMNLISMFPFIYPSTSQISVSLSLALPLWLSIMLFGWTKNFLSMTEHLLPQGTPNLLMPFMVCIELVSNIIRPITLSIRLSANMIAGHLLLTLLGNSSLETKNFLMISIFSQLILMILETAVAIIQSYVFTILCTLYSSEI